MSSGAISRVFSVWQSSGPELDAAARLALFHLADSGTPESEWCSYSIVDLAAWLGFRSWLDATLVVAHLVELDLILIKWESPASETFEYRLR